jgi:hypothetical protein
MTTYQVNLLSAKEDIKEQPTSRNLSGTARRVLQCGNIFQLSVPCSAVNVQNRIEYLLYLHRFTGSLAP